MLQGEEPLKVYIIIPVFNGWPQTRQCLEALRQSHCQDFHTIIIDHGSSDETSTHLERDHLEVTRIVASDSLWWAGATNAGVEYALNAGARLIMLLNNDCYPEPDCIGNLLAHYAGNRSNDRQRIIAPQLIDNDTLAPLVTAARSCLALGFPTLATKPNRHAGTDELIPCRLIMGARGVIIPAAVFGQVGLFDAARLPHYLADHDFYLRCDKAGISLLIDPSATVRVDNTRTTMASNLADLSLSQFRTTLSGQRSHRNIRDLTQFFRNHYPIPRLYVIGVALNLCRYTLLYFTARATRVFRRQGIRNADK